MSHITAKIQSWFKTHTQTHSHMRAHTHNHAHTHIHVHAHVHTLPTLPQHIHTHTHKACQPDPHILCSIIIAVKNWNCRWYKRAFTMISSGHWCTQSSTSHNPSAVKFGVKRMCGILWNICKLTSQPLKINILSVLITNTNNLTGASIFLGGRGIIYPLSVVP